MEDIKAYLEERIQYIVKTRGIETIAEQELKRVLTLVDAKLNID